MKKLICYLFILLLISACSFHSRQTKQPETGRSESKENKQLSEANTSRAVDTDQESIQSVSMKEEVSKVEKVLNKKINAKTFDEDMKVIEESNLYDKITCQSLRYSYNLVKQYSPNSWDITYRRALEGSREGSKSAKRIESISSSRN